MIPVLTAEDVRRQDEEAQARGVSVERLMENAGWAVARTAREMLGGTYGRRIVVVCGKGNNGGDGLVAARTLMEMGAHVTVVPVFAESSLNTLATKNLERFDGVVRPLSDLQSELARADLVIDAIFGVGLTRAPEGAIADAIAAMFETSASTKTLAVDVPSGVDSDTGAVWGPVVLAHVTVTFEGYKPGLLFAPGRDAAGEVRVEQIGVPVNDGRLPRAFSFEGPPRSLLPLRWGGSKREAGTVLVIAGSEAMPGAAILASAATVQGGAGLTTLLAPPRVCSAAIARTPEMTTLPAPVTEDGTIDPKAFDLIDFDRYQAIVMGPGLSTNARTADLVRAVVAGKGEVPLILDADGLNAFVGAQNDLTDHPGLLIITPHAGELSRSMDRPVPELEADRLKAAADAADRFRCVAVFKGPGTVIASPGGGNRGTVINSTGDAALAQGGTGDVLAGLIGAFVGFHNRRMNRAGETLEGASASQVVAAAVWLHGRAADRLAQRLWPHPANASALIEEIGPTMHEMMTS